MDPASADAGKPAPGLPPVQPPSGRFIAQLFLVPGLIILGVVMILLAFSYWTKQSRDPGYFLQQLDSDNADVRWRGASDLAQILKRGEPAALRWKADPKLALELADRLDRAFQALIDDEKVLAQLARSNEKEKHLQQQRQLRRQRDYISFLAASLGEFHVAVGAPVLCKMLAYEDSPDKNGNTLQRRMTLWALMNLGENLKAFSKIPAPDQEAILAKLKNEATPSKPHRERALTGLYYADKNLVSSDDLKAVVKVDERLIACAKADDQFLRKLVAMSFNFWDGPNVNDTLKILARDKGTGTLLRVEEND